MADNVITVIREAIISIYNHVNRVPPVWVQDDEDRGWDRGPGGMRAHAMLIKSGASLDDPNVIKVCYIQDNQEYLSEVLPPGTDPLPYLMDLIRRVKVPISGVRAYEGDNLIHDRPLSMRGS